MRERVLVIKNSLILPFFSTGDGCLLTAGTQPLFSMILDKHLFKDREEAEQDFSHKQVIPYVIIRHSDSYLMLKRTDRQAEKRLHNKYSLGIGGHINPSEAASEKNIILGGLYRELSEEIKITGASTPRFIGIINDERNSVSRVHLGLLYEIEADDPRFRVLEDDKMTAQWVNTAELGHYYEGLETWSQIVYDNYITLSPAGRAES